MGAAVALVVAARRPERVDRLALVAPLVHRYPVPPEFRALALPYAGPALFRAAATRGLVRRLLLRRIFYDPVHVTDEAVDYVWERINRPGGFEAAHAALRFVADPAAVASSVRAVRAPSLVVWGEEDRLFPPANARQLAADLISSRLVLIPRCGHAVAEERPQELLDALLPFLAASERPSLRAVSP
jgi:pimeloyl-ACP methyl ester carboxylesterase